MQKPSKDLDMPSFQKFHNNKSLRRTIKYKKVYVKVKNKTTKKHVNNLTPPVEGGESFHLTNQQTLKHGNNTNKKSLFDAKFKFKSTDHHVGGGHMEIPSLKLTNKNESSASVQKKSGLNNAFADDSKPNSREPSLGNGLNPQSSLTPDLLMRKGTMSAIGNLHIEANMFINEKKGKITNDYDVQATVGKGGYGEVKKVIHKITSELRAMKVIKKESCDETYLKSLSNEINILRQLDHPHIIKLYEIYQDQSSIYMITEFLGGGELFDALVKRRSLNESISAKIMK